MSRVTEIIVLLAIAMLIARISAKESWFFTQQSNVRYHHVHHALSTGAHESAEHESVDPTSQPHPHSDDLDKKQHEHCHTHGIAHVAGDTLFFAGIDFNAPEVIALREGGFIAREKRMFSSYAAHHFRPPILA